MQFAVFKKQFDQQFKAYLSKKIKASTSLVQQPAINSYLKYIDTYVFSGGKRIRPYCTYLAYTGLGGHQTKEMMQYSMVFELLHTMALIHDDIIDKSPRRHNVDTVHHHIQKNLGKQHADTANAQALLIGDIMLARVYELLFMCPAFDKKLLPQAQNNVHQMIEEVILGQMIDVQMMTGMKTDQKLIEKKNTYKTASYTFTRPLLTGAILAGANKKVLQQIAQLGDDLGRAFQLRDDLKDILATETDKEIFSDIQEGQQTFFTRYIEKNGTPTQKKTVKDSMKKILSPKQIAELQKIFFASGAIDAGKRHILAYSKKALALLKNIPLQKAAKDEVLLLIKKISDLSI